MTESPFDTDFTDEYSDQLTSTKKQIQQENWEDKVVKHLFSSKNLLAEYKQLVNEKRQKGAGWILTFDDFYKVHPEFPVYLFCQKIPYIHEMTFEQLFKKPEKTKLVKAFINVNTDLEEGKLYGLVFEWLHSGKPIKIIHNWLGSNGWCTCIRVNTPNGYSVIEDFDSFLCNSYWKA